MKIFLPLAVIALFVLSVNAQVFEFACTDRNPAAANEFQIWLERDVRYLVSKAEKDHFLKLETDAARIDFIEKFWQRRDPSPTTKENEFRVRFCERVAETERFKTDLPGWRTDRGKVYILYGKPAETEKGNTEMGSLKNVPFEKWTYIYMSGATLREEFVFTDPTRSNEYRLPKEVVELLDFQIANNKFGLGFETADPIENR